jgi:GntR family transcriptional regulator of vanillate catabolism
MTQELVTVSKGERMAATEAKQAPRSSASVIDPAMFPESSEPISLAIHQENLEDKIYARIRALILQRQIRPGERIQVDRLAREMGVSRMPVMNAVKRLTQERVVDCLPRRGFYLKEYSKRELARLFEVREMLEALAARLAALRITQEQLDELNGMFQGLDLSPTPEALARYIERDRLFHSRLIGISGNPHLAHAMNSINLMIFTYQHGLTRLPEETIREHLGIIAALRRRDAEASEAAMRRHMRQSVERLHLQADAEESRGESKPTV